MLIHETHITLRLPRGSPLTSKIVLDRVKSTSALWTPARVKGIFRTPVEMILYDPRSSFSLIK